MGFLSVMFWFGFFWVGLFFFFKYLGVGKLLCLLVMFESVVKTPG